MERISDMSKIYKYECPCKKCKDRVLNCHSKCEKYKSWKKDGVEEPKEPFFEIKKSRK